MNLIIIKEIKHGCHSQETPIDMRPAPLFMLR